MKQDEVNFFNLPLGKLNKRSCIQFDVLVAALPLSDGGEEAQLKRIAELQVRCFHCSSLLPSPLQRCHPPTL